MAAGAARGPWLEAKRKPFRNLVPHWDTFPKGGKFDFRDLTSIFFSEIPDDHKAEDLFGIFGCIGDIQEVSIAPRLNKLGKRYGFARFRGEEDSRLLAVRCDNVQLLGKKIHANIPRFACALPSTDKYRGFHHASSSGTGLKGAVNRNAGGLGMNRFVDKRSFAEAVWVLGGDERRKLVDDRVDLSFSSKEVDRERFNKALVGYLVDSGSVVGAQQVLNKEGFFGIAVSLLGASSCLLEELVEGALDEFVKEDNQWRNVLFSKICNWNVHCVDEFRLTWLNILGLPCHAWNPEFFSALGNLVGFFICTDEHTVSGRAFNSAKILVRVRINVRIREALKVDIDGIRFVLRISEEKPFHFARRSGVTIAGGTDDESSSCVDSDEMSYGVTVDYDDDLVPDSGGESGSVQMGLSEVGGKGTVNPVAANLGGIHVSPEMQVVGDEDISEFSSGVPNSLLGNFDEALSNLQRKNLLSDAQELVSRIRQQDEGSCNFGSNVDCNLQAVGHQEARSSSPIVAAVCDLQVQGVMVDKDRKGKRKSKTRNMRELGGIFNRKIAFPAKSRRPKPRTVSAPFLVQQDTLDAHCSSIPAVSVNQSGRMCMAASSGTSGQMEDVDIACNNKRQWELVYPNANGKLLKAIENLGISNSKGRLEIAQRVVDLIHIEKEKIESKKEKSIGLK